MPLEQRSRDRDAGAARADDRRAGDFSAVAAAREAGDEADASCTRGERCFASAAAAFVAVARQHARRKR